jgi:hypothetical protein
MTFRIALVQPISHRLGEDEANNAAAVPPGGHGPPRRPPAG